MRTVILLCVAAAISGCGPYFNPAAKKAANMRMIVADKQGCNYLVESRAGDLVLLIHYPELDGPNCNLEQQP